MTSFARSTDGARIAYASEGDGAPVLLIHGFASNRLSWWSNGWASALMKAGIRVIAIDLRGHGESDKPRDPSAYGDRNFDDLVAVMKAADAPMADIMGYSMGSIVTIGFLMRHRDHVRRAVIGGVGATYFTGNHLLGHSIVDALEAENPATISDPIDRLHRFLATRNGNDRFALAALMRASHRLYAPADLMTVSQPVLVACGADDAITGPPAPLADSFANGRALLLPGSDHGTALDHPALKSAVVEFLSRPSSTGGA
jgi:pimeloyl-ACP methyl ester carboxylesterase